MRQTRRGFPPIRWRARRPRSTGKGEFPMSLARNVIVQTTMTLGSRLLGFARDLMLNARFGGQSPLMDAWTKALWLPNLFRRLFAEGAFAQAFVPVFAKTLQQEGQAAAETAASQ